VRGVHVGAGWFSGVQIWRLGALPRGHQDSGGHRPGFAFMVHHRPIRRSFIRVFMHSFPPYRPLPPVLIAPLEGSASLLAPLLSQPDLHLPRCAELSRHESAAPVRQARAGWGESPSLEIWSKVDLRRKSSCKLEKSKGAGDGQEVALQMTSRILASAS
jgi:hypothetical protein